MAVYPFRQDTCEHALSQCAEQANRHHREVTDRMREVLKHAIAAGKALVWASRYCPHGTWTTWLRDNFQASAETARAYMRVYRQRRQIETVNAFRKKPLTLDEALRFIRVQKAQKSAQPSTSLSDAEPRRRKAIEARQMILETLSHELKTITSDEVIAISGSEDLYGSIIELLQRARDAHKEELSRSEAAIANTRQQKRWELQDAQAAYVEAVERVIDRKWRKRQMAEAAYEDWLATSRAQSP